MEVVIFGKHVDVTPGLRTATEEKLKRLERFASDVRRIEVDYGAINNPRVADSQTCEILVHVTGHLVKGHAAAPEQHAALDLALDKVEHQLRKLHSRRTRKRNVRRNGTAPPDEGDALDAMLATAFAGESDDGGDGDDGTVIVKSKTFGLKPMEPEEAALQMDLLGHDFFLFTNAGNGRASVLYRRRDGNLGLIETTG